MRLERKARLAGDPPTFQRYTAVLRERPGEVLNIIFEAENSEVTAHLSVSVWSRWGELSKWLRLPTDSEMKRVATVVFGRRPWEEDNVGSNGMARHIWAIERVTA